MAFSSATAVGFYGRDDDGGGDDIDEEEGDDADGAEGHRGQDAQKLRALEAPLQGKYKPYTHYGDNGTSLTGRYQISATF